MKQEKAPYSPTPGDYDTEKLTDLHSPNTKPSHYARNIQHALDSSTNSNDRYNSSTRSIEREKASDPTKRIPTLIKYSDMNKDSDEFEYKGEI